MSNRMQNVLGRALAVLAVTLTLAAPAAADHGWGPPGAGYGHPACQGYPGLPPGMGECPYLKGMDVPAPMAGKSLGVYISDPSNAMLDAASTGYGVNVAKVLPDSPAAAAGIRSGDLITEFAGKPVLSGDRLRWLVNKAEAGKPVEIKLVREGKAVTLSVTLKAPEPKCKCDCDEKAAPRVGT
jgi:S1-C subfamily serine protease